MSLEKFQDVLEYIPKEELITNPRNPRKHPENQIKAIRHSIKKYGIYRPVLIDDKNIILAGHGLVEAAMPGTLMPCIRFTNLSQEEKDALMISDNASAEMGETNEEVIKALLDSSQGLIDILGEIGIELKGIDVLSLEKELKLNPKNLADRFLIPPFSIFRGDKSDWIECKKALNYMIGDSGVRGGQKVYKTSDILGQLHKNAKNVSILDANLARILFNLFCPRGGRIIDPFAGSVQGGFIAGLYGFKYLGNELRQEQVDANNSLLKRQDLLSDDVKYIQGDGTEFYSPVKADMIFSCPPYFDLEKYSNSEQDISNMSFDGFMAAIKQSFANAYSYLNDDSFCCVVLGDIRDKKTGFYRSLIHKFVVAMEEIGFNLYNEAVLCDPTSTAALRAGKAFASNRKFIKVHQNIFIFFKGNPKNINQKFGNPTVIDTVLENYQINESEEEQENVE